MRDISQKYTKVLKNRHKYVILAQNQSIDYVHEASMAVGHPNQYEQNRPIHLCAATTNIQNIFNNGLKCYILARVLKNHD